ncbi:MAG: fatty acid desaturase, partial [Bacteroidetes bacterium]|nr:fatty acid desaturase [Bacteroidota bacterium]
KTITVEEYKSYSLGKRIYYRIYRNPIIIFLIAPFFLFTIAMRFPNKTQSFKSKLYTHLTTIGLILGVILISLLIGLKTFLLIQIPILYFASVAGVWLFYLQHQFEDVIWERDENWDYKIIAMEGSSYLKLPKILQWFSGNIGFHHLHHLSPKIPNYNLEKCIRENPIFQKEPLTFWPSIRSMRYRLWDEKKHKLVSLREALSS